MTIGKYYEAALRDLDTPGTGYYIPYPSGAMNCEELTAQAYNLKNQLQLWQQRLSVSTVTEERNNITAIIEQQTDKLAQYETELQRCSAVAPAESSTMIPNDTGEDKRFPWLVLVAVAFGIWLVFKRKKQTYA